MNCQIVRSSLTVLFATVIPVCAAAPVGDAECATLLPRWEGNDIVAGSKRLSVKPDSKLVLTEGGKTLFTMQYMCRAESKATGKTLWPNPSHRFAEEGGTMVRDGNALIHERAYRLEDVAWEDAFRQRVELLPDGLVSIEVVWTDPENDNFTFRPKGASWTVPFALAKDARFSVNGEVREFPQAPRNGGDTWKAKPDGTIEYVFFEGDAARRFRVFTRPGEAGDTAYLFSLAWGNEFRITEKSDGRRHGYRLYLDLREGAAAPPCEPAAPPAEDASGAAAPAFRSFVYDRPMEIGNYDVEIALADGPGTNFVKFAGRRLGVDRTELVAGERRTVSFTARVPGPYTTRKGDEHANRRLRIELFADAPQAGAAAFAPRVTPNPSAPTIYICGDSTVADHRNEPLGSWGLVLPAFVRRGWATANFAESGRSLKTFEEEGRLERLFEHLAKDDWVMIQFGHNDQKIPGEEAENGYTRRLGDWIDRIREKGAHPIVVTPVERRGFHPAHGTQWGKSLAKYAEAAKAVAAAKGVPCIDLNDASYRMMGTLGAEGSKKLQRPIDGANVDNTHHSMYGAYEMARIVAAGLADIPVVGDAIREPYRAFDPEKPDPEDAVAIPPSGAFNNIKPAGN